MEGTLSGGKKWASGVINTSIYVWGSDTNPNRSEFITLNLPFTPSLIFINNVEINTGYDRTERTSIDSSLTESNKGVVTTYGYKYGISFWMSEISALGFRMNIYRSHGTGDNSNRSISFENSTWYAFE